MYERRTFALEPKIDKRQRKLNSFPKYFAVQTKSDRKIDASTIGRDFHSPAECHSRCRSFVSKHWEIFSDQNDATYTKSHDSRLQWIRTKT